MATLKVLPNEIIYMIIFEVAQLSYRDRARVACVSKECLRIADSEESYRAQYIRDFKHPPQNLWPRVSWLPMSWYHTSAEPGSEPPNHWKEKLYEVGYDCVGQESSWKRAYIRRHNLYFPQELYSSLPVVPYDQKYTAIAYAYRLDACNNPLTAKGYLVGLRRHWRLCRSVAIVMAKQHGVHPSVEAKMALRGWVLGRHSLELLDAERVDFAIDRCYRCRGIEDKIARRNRRRRDRLQEAEIGARSMMAQVPKWGTES